MSKVYCIYVYKQGNNSGKTCNNICIEYKNEKMCGKHIKQYMNKLKKDKSVEKIDKKTTEVELVSKNLTNRTTIHNIQQNNQILAMRVQQMENKSIYNDRHNIRNTQYLEIQNAENIRRGIVLVPCLMRVFLK